LGGLRVFALVRGGSKVKSLRATELTHFLKTSDEHYVIGRNPSAVINFMQPVMST
jgi:hypothetical protein